MGSSGNMSALLLGLAGLACLLSSTGSRAENVSVSVPGRLAPYHASLKPPARMLADPKLDRVIWSQADVVRWGELNTAPLIQEDNDREHMVGVPLRVGVPRSTPHGLLSSQTAGRWIQGPDGSMLWTLELESPGAKSIRINFSRFQLPEGGRVVITGDGNNPTYAYHGDGPIGKGHFLSHTIYGESVYVEYQPPPGQSAVAVIEIDEIVHAYRDTAGSQSFSLALPCEEDVTCYTVDAIAQAAVGRMYFGNGYTCSGALLNDVDTNTSAGYFLTANHCLNTQALVDTLEITWLYETDSCGGSTTWSSTSLGGTLLATSDYYYGTDFTFLRLADDPQEGQGFAAWTSASPTGPVVGIHHPQGEWKRVSFGTLTTSDPVCAPDLPLERYWYLSWEDGITESGSSGSPLFNSNWEVVGQLFGSCYYPQNPPGCDTRDLYNTAYGKFAISFNQFTNYLALDIAPDDEYEDNDELGQAVSISNDTHSMRLVDFDDFFQFTTCESDWVSVTATFDTADMDLDLRLLTTGGSVMVASTGSTGTETVSAMLPAGDYIIHAVKEHGWGGDYTLHVDVPNNYGDVTHDGALNVFDLFCILNGFGGSFEYCTFEDCDLMPCGGNGVINVNDLFAAINAFGGSYACRTCP